MLESRLASRLSADHGYTAPERMVAAAVPPSVDPGGEESDAVAANAVAPRDTVERAAVAMVSSHGDEDGPPAFDEAAESAFRAEARDRGEAVARPVAADNGEADDDGSKAMPKLDELVNRIPPEIRDVLDELFRARFVTVKRFPKKVLKG